ncbi:hypothetical protein K2X05_13350 [bacterium]|nr:hypothetical protein [bacterium]
MEKLKLDSQLIKPHYSTKLVRSFYNYLKKYYSEKLFDDIIADLGLPKSYLLNDDNWISNNYSKALCEKIIEKTQNKNIFFEIGSELLSSDNINPFEHELIKLMPPYILFKMMPGQSQKLNNIFKLSLLKSSPGHFIYRIDSIDKEEQAHEAVFQNTEGCFYAFKTMLNLNSFELKNKLLINENGEKYKVIELKYSAYTFWIKKVSPVLIISSIFFYTISNISAFEKSIITNIATFSILGLLILLFVSLNILNSFVKLVKGNKLYYKNTKEKNEHIYEKTKELEHKLREEQYIKNICLTLIKAKKPEDIIDDSLNSICLNQRYQKAMVMIASEKNKNLKTVSLRGITEDSKLKSLVLSYPAIDQESYLFANILDNKSCAN